MFRKIRYLIELLDGLDVVVGDAQPGEEFQLLEAFHDGDVVAAQVQDLEVGQLGHLEHPDQPVVLD